VIIAVIVVLVSTAFVWFLGTRAAQPSNRGFQIYSVQNNTLLISDGDVLAYNWTSQEMTITPAASERLNMTTDLYSWSGIVVRINGEEVYRGVIRSPIMSAVPGPPQISIEFPSVNYPSSLPNYGAIRLFYPFFQPPNDQQTSNAKMLHYFEEVNKLEY
jgi:hypothetical protein